MNEDELRSELDDVMLDFYQRTTRLSDPAERPPTPKIVVETKTVSTKKEGRPINRGVTVRTNNANANPNNSVRG
jgi:hypothetical protein